MTNQQIIDQFEKLVASLVIQDQKKYFYQIRSYENVIQVIRDLPEELADIYAREKDLEQIEGIGQAIEQKIIDLLTTGHSAELDKIIGRMPPAMFPLLKITGVGAKKAYRLATELDLSDDNPMADLAEAAKQQRIRELDGFGAKSEAEILEAIERSHHQKDSITRIEAQQIAQPLIKFLEECDACEEVLPLGSTRRQKATVRDIDIGVATNDFEAVKKHLKKYPGIAKILAQGDNLVRIITRENVQVDVKGSPPARWGAFLQHFTGSKEHNIKLREYSLKKGLSLSEHGIKRLDNPEEILEFATEEDFYKFLGLKWVPPEKRVGNDEIEKVKV